jgi:hypothetical protein
MPKPTFPIEAANLEVVKAYLQRQFNQLSWWPTEQPWKAKEEFEVMHNTPERLTAWYEKWLDGGEWRKLKEAIQKSKVRSHRA